MVATVASQCGIRILIMHLNFTQTNDYHVLVGNDSICINIPPSLMIERRMQSTFKIEISDEHRDAFVSGIFRPSSAILWYRDNS